MERTISNPLQFTEPPRLFRALNLTQLYDKNVIAGQSFGVNQNLTFAKLVEFYAGKYAGAGEIGPRLDRLYWQTKSPIDFLIAQCQGCTGKIAGYRIFKLFSSNDLDGKVWQEQRNLTREDLMKILEAKIKTIDFQAAGQDVAAFIKDPVELEGWNQEMFLAAIRDLKIENT